MTGPLRVLELFSGIGGMHLALERLGVPYGVVAAVEINDMANKIYRMNFPNANLLQKNIEGLTVKQILKLNPNTILMSPPCQPFTRSGLKQDVGDKRCSPLLHLLEILPELPIIQNILLENVVGFESSLARDQVVEVLRKLDFTIQEFHLCPSQLNIPNRRPRYYLLAKRLPGNFKIPLDSSLHTNFPVRFDDDSCPSVLSSLQNSVLEKTDNLDECFKIKEILDSNVDDKDLVKEKDLRFFMEFDLVTPKSRLSACFTKSYKRYFLGTGSVFIEDSKKLAELDTSLPDNPAWVHKQLKPRFFTSKEILRLMAFPEWYRFPDDITRKQAAAVLGNSINIHVVALLIGLLSS